MTYDHCSRRQLLGAAGVAGVGVVALAGCGTRASGSAVPSEIKGKPIAKTSEIPVGGGKVFGKWNIVITQPAQGTFKALSAVCTHQGCTVDRIQSNVIACPCHGSEFNATDGSVKEGPADRPLKGFPVRVQGTDIIVG